VVDTFQNCVGLLTMGIPFSFGVRFLYDAHLRYFRPGLPTAIRIRNYETADAGYSEFGFQYSPTGQLQFQAGFTDIVIDPPPEVKEVSLHNIGLNQARLQFGAKNFIISQTWVLARMNQMQYTDPIQVFRDPSVIGIAYPYLGNLQGQLPSASANAQTRLFSIESITHDEIAGETLAYTVLCNATETLVNVPGGP